VEDRTDGGLPSDDDSYTPEVGTYPERRRRFFRTLREWVLVIGSALLIAVVLRTFVVQQFYISGPSMEPTLVGDDRVLVNKLAYRVGSPGRGDVVVFDRITTNGGVIQHDDLIKRVIGLPGEEVEIRQCTVYVDGQPVDEPWLTAEMKTNCGVAEMDPVFVGTNEVFVVGDHRDQSYDSRMFGTVSQSLIRGRAMVVIWPPASVTIL
jgi:signal peptidase I